MVFWFLCCFVSVPLTSLCSISEPFPLFLLVWNALLLVHSLAGPCSLNVTIHKKSFRSSGSFRLPITTLSIPLIDFYFPQRSHNDHKSPSACFVFIICPYLYISKISPIEQRLKLHTLLQHELYGRQGTYMAVRDVVRRWNLHWLDALVLDSGEWTQALRYSTGLRQDAGCLQWLGSHTC